MCVLVRVRALNSGASIWTAQRHMGKLHQSGEEERRGVTAAQPWPHATSGNRACLPFNPVGLLPWVRHIAWWKGAAAID